MKRIGMLSIVFAAVLALGACGDKNKESKPDEQAQTGGEAKPTEGAPATGAPEEKPAMPATGGEDLSGMSNEQLTERMISYMDEIAVAAQRAGGDCDKMAQELETLAGKGTGASLMAEAEKREKTMTPEEQTALQEKYQPQMMEKLGPMMQSIEQCQDNERVQGAVQKLLPQG